MFDEYPDRLMIERVMDRIYQNVKAQDDHMTAEQYRGGRNPNPDPPGRPDGPPPFGPPPHGRDPHLWGLIGVLLNNEMYRRRCRHRRCRRWW